MSTAWEKFQSATLALVRSGSIKDRLDEAYRNHVAFVLEDDVPKEARDELRALHVAIRRERPMSRGEDEVRATIRKLSNEEADRMASMVVRIFSLMPRSAPMLVRSGATAQVVPLYIVEPSSSDVEVAPLSNETRAVADRTG